MADERARAARAAEKADAEFSAEFLNAAREVRSPCPIKLFPARAFVLFFGVMSRVELNAPSP